MKKAKKRSEIEKLFRIRTRVNKDLDKYEDQILLPEKQAKIEEILKKAKLPYGLKLDN